MALSPKDATEVVPYLTSAATIVALQKWLKTRAWYQTLTQAIPGSDKWTHWLVAGVASFVASLGIHVVWDWDVIKGGQAVFTIPGFWDLAHGLADWWKVYILQHTVYEATSSKPLLVSTPAPATIIVTDVQHSHQPP
jgi:hypothetical protein